MIKFNGPYVVGVRCNNWHSGNRRFSELQRGYFQCAGCGEMVAAHAIETALLAPITGIDGRGGVARVVETSPQN